MIPKIPTEIALSIAAIFLDWQHKLHRNDQLPRGCFFKGKKAGKPVVIIDECHRYFSSPMSDLINLSKFK